MGRRNANKLLEAPNYNPRNFITGADSHAPLWGNIWVDYGFLGCLWDFLGCFPKILGCVSKYVLKIYGNVFGKEEYV